MTMERTKAQIQRITSALTALFVASALVFGLSAIFMQTADADTPPVQTQAGSWAKSHGKWWYKYADGTYPASDQVIIGGKIYSFDASGYMKTGWKLEDGSWHYYKSSGAMATGWAKVKGTWYYMDSEGAMQTGWQKISDKWYYLKGSGAMKTGWLQDQGSWYYLSSSGAMKTGWLKSGSKWYYMSPTDGKMATGKQVIGGKTYILASSGAMKTGWVQDGGKWYYANSSGACKTNGWVGNYYLASDGAMATSGWVDNNKYYVDGSGKWVKKPSAAQLATKPGNSGSTSQGGSSSAGNNGSSSGTTTSTTGKEQAEIKYDKALDEWIKSYIRPDMTPYEKVETIQRYAEQECKYVPTPYVANMLYEKKGNCATGAAFLVDVCDKIGIRAEQRFAGNDPINYGQSSTHENAFVWIDGVQYIADCTPESYIALIKWEPERWELERKLASGEIPLSEGPQNQEAKPVMGTLGASGENYLSGYTISLGLTKRTLSLEIPEDNPIDILLNFGAYNHSIQSFSTSNEDVLSKEKNGVTINPSEYIYFIVGKGSTTLSITLDDGSVWDYRISII